MSNYTTHPRFLSRLSERMKWRYCWEGGYRFIDNYLEKFSTRETQDDFEFRKKMTYCPAFAKAEIKNIRNSMYSRFSDITRQVNSNTLLESIDGVNGGVDGNGSTMNYFIGNYVLEELMVMGEVGIYVDNESDPTRSLADKTGKPYLYVYTAEQIKSWRKNKKGQLIKLVLEDNCEEFDGFGLVSGFTTRERFYELVDGKVKVTLSFPEKDENEPTEYILPLKRIPFVHLTLSDSLMADIANYQIALLNLESSDISFLMRSNFAFYVEQYDPQALMQSHLVRGNQVADQNKTEGTKTTSEASNERDTTIGISKGRRYGKGLEAPQFISPPTEPIQASMEKQEQMKRDIKILLNQSIASLKSNRTSAESKQEDQTAEEEGLSYIGLELEFGERQIAEIWCEYEGITNPNIIINYPTTYELKSEDTRMSEVKNLANLMYKVPSKAYREQILIKMVKTLFASKLAPDQLTNIITEIRNSPATVMPDPDELAKDIEMGVLSAETGSKLRGYPAGEVDKAQIEHAERAQRIAQAQADVANRGVKDLSSDPNVTKDAIKGVHDSTMNDTSKKQIRGGAKK